MDRIARRLLHLGRRQLDALSLRPGLDLVADHDLDLAPVAIERGGEVAARRLWPVTAAPGRTIGILGGNPGSVRSIILEALKEGLPLRVNRCRIGQIARVQVLHVGSIAAVEERGQSESRIGVLAGHIQIPEWVTIDLLGRTRARANPGSALPSIICAV